MGSEEGRFRTLPSGNQLREPCWYREKCEWCRKEAGRECCLLQVRLVDGPEKEKEGEGGKGKGKEGGGDGEGKGKEVEEGYPRKKIKIEGEMEGRGDGDEMEF